MGLVTPVPSRVSLSIGDDGTGLDALALGWIHVNCGVTCHNSNPSAAGYGAAMFLRLDPTQLDGSPPDAATWNILKTTVGIPCVSGSIIGQPRILPGAPARSEIYQLIASRGVLQMPPIASRVVDTSDVAVVASWIRSLANDGGGPSADAGPSDAGEQPDSADAGALEASAADAGDGGYQAPDGDDSDAETADSGTSTEDAADAGDGGYQAPDGDELGVESADSGTSAEDAADD
jgi:hypothetical protein